MLFDLLNIFANNIAPLLIIAGVGFVLRRKFLLEPRQLSTIMFNVLTPCLVFWSLYSGEVSGDEFVGLFLGTVIFQAVMAGIALGIGTIWGVSSIERSTLILSSFCMNAGNYGLPLIAFAFGEEAAARAAVIYVANVATSYSAGVYVASNGKSSPINALKDMLKAPPLYAFTAAMILRTLNVDIPPMLARPIESLGTAAIPMMLLVLGLQLGATTAIKRIPIVTSGVSLRLLLSPFIAFGVATLLQLDSFALIAFLIQTSMPIAVLTIILATEFDLDQELMLNLIMATTLLSPISLSILILLVQTHLG